MTEWLTDKNGNSCSVEFFGTHFEAKQALNSLINCTNCINCEYCNNCHCCNNCQYCRGCIDCDFCTNCKYCTNYERCNDCTNPSTEQTGDKQDDTYTGRNIKKRHKI